MGDDDMKHSDNGTSLSQYYQNSKKRWKESILVLQLSCDTAKEYSPIYKRMVYCEDSLNGLFKNVSAMWIHGE